MNIDSPLEVAKGISEHGLLVMTAAFYLVITAIILLVFLAVAKKILTGIINEWRKILEEMITLQRGMSVVLTSINEGIKDKTFQQAKVIGISCIENTKYEICIEAERIKLENNLSDKDAVMRKINAVIINLYNKRFNRFDGLYYHGKKLMDYTSTEWVKKVTDTVIDNIYSEDYSVKTLRYNLNILYDEIINEFLKNLIK